MKATRKNKAIGWVLVGLLVVQTACNRGGSGGPVQGQEQAPQFKPGFNLMSPEQDIAIGRQNAAQIEREMRVLPDQAVQQYVNNVGKRLSAHAPGVP